MGEAIIAKSRKYFSLYVCEKEETRQAYLKRRYKVNLGDMSEVIRRSQIIVVAVKPQDVETVFQQLSQRVGKNKLIISIAAGITLGYMEKVLGPDVHIIRTMPNMPALVGQGITAIAPGRAARKKDIDAARRLLNLLGKTVVVEEKWLDAVTAVSGSGPAYVFLFIECLIKAAQELGLEESLAKELVMMTFRGSIHLLEKRKEEPGLLRAKVTSKGGTTQAAMDVFIEQHIDEIIAAAVKAASQRAGELADTILREVGDHV